MTDRLKELAQLAISPPYSGDALLAIRIAGGAMSDFHKAATPIAVLTLIEDNEQQRDVLLELLVEARDHVVSSTRIVRGGFIDEIDAAIAACQQGGEA